MAVMAANKCLLRPNLFPMSISDRYHIPATLVFSKYATTTTTDDASELESQKDRDEAGAQSLESFAEELAWLMYENRELTVLSSSATQRYKSEQTKKQQQQQLAAVKKKGYDPKASRRKQMASKAATRQVSGRVGLSLSIITARW